MAFGIDDVGLMLGAQVLGGVIQGDATKGAASLQAGATDRATALAKQQFDQVRADQAPYRAGGSAAMNLLRSFLGIDPAAMAAKTGPRTWKAATINDARQGFDADTGAYYGRYGYGDPGNDSLGGIASTWNVDEALDADGNVLWTRPGFTRPAAPAGDGAAADPYQKFGTSPLNARFTVDDFWQDPVTKLGYQTGLDLGTKALRNAAPLTTGMDSGAALKELTKFGTDYTGMKAGESEARFEGEKSNVFNRLMAMITGGQVANQTTANAGTNMANTTGQLITAGANAGGAAKIAGANAWGGALNNLSNWWNQNQMIDKLTKGGLGTFGGTATPLSNFAFTGNGVGGYQYG